MRSHKTLLSKSDIWQKLYTKTKNSKIPKSKPDTWRINLSTLMLTSSGEIKTQHNLHRSHQRTITACHLLILFLTEKMSYVDTVQTLNPNTSEPQHATSAVTAQNPPKSIIRFLCIIGLATWRRQRPPKSFPLIRSSNSIVRGFRALGKYRESNIPNCSTWICELI